MMSSLYRMVRHTRPSLIVSKLSPVIRGSFIPLYRFLAIMVIVIITGHYPCYHLVRGSLVRGLTQRVVSSSGAMNPMW